MAMTESKCLACIPQSGRMVELGLEKCCGFPHVTRLLLDEVPLQQVVPRHTH
jgi:hypothetical protein